MFCRHFVRKQKKQVEVKKSAIDVSDRLLRRTFDCYESPSTFSGRACVTAPPQYALAEPYDYLAYVGSIGLVFCCSCAGVVLGRARPLLN